MQPPRPSSPALYGPLLSLLLALAACPPLADDAVAAGHEPPAPEVSTVVVGTTRVARARDLPGRLVASRTAEVRAQVAGIVLERVLAEGSAVREGEVLFRIDPAVYRAERDERAGALERAEATRALALRQAKRAETLRERETVSTAHHDLAASALEQADADVTSARARLSRAKIDLDRATVRAPISGRIGRALVTEGALVGQGEATHLATIHQIDPIYVDFTQPVSLDERDRDDASVEVRLVRDDGSLHEAVGRLLFSDISVDPSTARVSSRAAFPNPDGLLRPGAYVRVRITGERDTDAIVVPPQAIQRSSAGEAQAFVVDAAGRVTLKPLRTGPLTDVGWIVEEGLSPGDVVVVEGFQKLQIGATVQARPWAAATAAGPEARS